MSVFISHALEDQLFVRQIARILRNADLEVWDNSEILPGDNWAAMTSEALEKADVLVVILTTDSVHSAYVKREIAYALGQERFDGRLIPVLADSSVEGEVPWALKSLNVIRLYKNTQGQGIQELYRRLIASIPVGPHEVAVQGLKGVDQNKKPRRKFLSSPDWASEETIFNIVRHPAELKYDENRTEDLENR